MSGAGLTSVAQLIEELMRINNEQANALRTAAKALAAAGGDRPATDEGLLDELSRMNNELAGMQRELARKNAELLRLNEQKNRLLGMAAHEQRSPLAVIQSYSEFLREEAAEALNEEQRSFVDAIWESSRFMLSVIDDLLDVAQIEAGTLQLETTDTDLAGLVRRNVALNQVLASRREIRLEPSVPDDPVIVSVDPHKIQQVLNNLLGNAIKYSQPRGTVWITVEADTAVARITVRDKGQGIAAEDLPRLFQPFARGSRTAASGEPSTGLGLAIVRRIVEGHGGRVAVASIAGEGSEFTVELPR